MCNCLGILLTGSRIVNTISKILLLTSCNMCNLRIIGRRRSMKTDYFPYRINFKEARIRRGLTQKEVAAAIGVPSRTYGAWERGEREPNLEDAFAIGDVLDCSLDFLAGRITQQDEEENQRVARLNNLFTELNSEGQEKVLAHCIDLLGNDKYLKDLDEKKTAPRTSNARIGAAGLEDHQIAATA